MRICNLEIRSDWIISRLLIYSVTSSGPEKEVGKTGTTFSIGRTSEPVEVRKTAERATLSSRNGVPQSER